MKIKHNFGAGPCILPSLWPEFLDYAMHRSMVGIKGYRTVSWFRASLYNALLLSSVLELITVMQEFSILKCEHKIDSESKIQY